ncbi:MAG: DUF547 domain-containing protein [Acidobacteriota bacterium]
MIRQTSLHGTHTALPLVKVGVVALGVWSVVACLAPPAEPIQGNIAAAIQRGITEGQATFDHTVWDEILQEFAVQGGKKFDYGELKKVEDKLDGYLRAVAEVDIASLSGNELFALFINAYNAYTVKTILNRVSPDGTYQIDSIRAIPDVFDLEDHVVGGYRLSLNNIEHNILRPFFKDPRVHFAVNCASTSCPPVPVRAFRGERLEEQLEAVTRNVLSSPDYVRVEGDRLLVTKILDWYGADFLTPSGYKGAEDNLPAFIRKYSREDVIRWLDSQPSSLSVKFMSYDWSLNRTS